MKVSCAIKNPVLVLFVFALFLLSTQAIAVHLHDIDELPSDDCPVCSASKVLSFADHSPPTLQQDVTFHEVFAQLPPSDFSPARQVNISHGKNRAPPRQLT